MNWHLVQTKPRQEKLAETTLQKMGVETFYPIFKQNKWIRKKEEEVSGPLFPGYLFARFDLETQYRGVNFAHGVRNLVSFGGEVAIIEEALIESIQSRVQNGFITIPPPSFVPGQLVTFRGGAFQGVEAIFQREMSDHQRIMVLMQTLSSPVRVIVDLRDVVNI